MNKIICKKKIQGTFTGDLLFSETSKKLYMIIKLTKEKYSLVNLDTGNIDYTDYTREDIINLSKELIYINNDDCRIEINY